MHPVPLVLTLLVLVSVLAHLARRVNLPYPAVMVVGGLLIGFLPLPRVELSPDLFFTLFLPPLLYAAAWQTSWRDFKANLRSISLLAIGFVGFTTIAIAACAHAMINGMTWPAALALGAIVSPPDAVAATAIVGRLGVPRRVVAILEGESLVNDASGLAFYRLAVAAVMMGGVGVADVAQAAVWSVVGGIGIGLAVGWVVVQVHKLMDDPLVETVVTLLTPLAAFLPAEHVHASGVLATVAMGLFISRRSHAIFSPDTRLHAEMTWDVAVFVLNGLVFVLVGLQLPLVIDNVHASGESWPRLIGLAVGLFVLMVVTRLAWVFPGAYLPRLIPAICKREARPSWQSVFMIGITGMRGATSLAAALALPLYANNGPFPRRNLIIFLTFSAILGTLVVQSLLLPYVVRWLGIGGDDDGGQCEEWDARLRAARAALDRIGELELVAVDGHRSSLRRLRIQYEERVQRLSLAEDEEATGHCATAEQLETVLYRHVLASERNAVIALRDTGRIGDDIRRRIERDLDLEESRLVAAGQQFGFGLG